MLSWINQWNCIYHIVLLLTMLHGLLRYGLHVYTCVHVHVDWYTVFLKMEFPSPNLIYPILFWCIWGNLIVISLMFVRLLCTNVHLILNYMYILNKFYHANRIMDTLMSMYVCHISVVWVIVYNMTFLLNIHTYVLSNDCFVLNCVYGFLGRL